MNVKSRDHVSSELGDILSIDNDVSYRIEIHQQTFLGWVFCQQSSNNNSTYRVNWNVDNIKNLFTKDLISPRTFPQFLFIER